MINFYFYYLNDNLAILILFIIAFLISCLLVIVSYFFVFQKPDSEKLSVYECGYEPYDNTRKSFNVYFCLIALFFLIFDIEILFLLPWCLNISNINLLGFWSMLEFLFELVLGYFYLFYSGLFNWN